MIIGIPKEIKTSEFRVSLSPAGAYSLVQKGHQILVEKNAGIGSGFKDEMYLQAGAKVIADVKSIYQESEMIVKVKEPLPDEYLLLRKKQILFTYLHLAASETLTKAIMNSNCIAIAYETVEMEDKSLPLLIPMSEVAGRMSIQLGAHFLEKAQGGKGKLLGGIPGVRPAKVVILGAGIVGMNAAIMASGLGAQVVLMDVNISRLRYLETILPKNIQTVFSNPYTIQEEIKNADIVIGAVLIPGAKAPVLLKKDMLSYMETGTVLIDIAVDQGGCIETCRPTSHTNPIYTEEGIIHYGVPNMPGAVPFTSTIGLTNATLPYIIQLADKGWERACAENAALNKGLNIVEGRCVLEPVKKLFSLS